MATRETEATRVRCEAGNANDFILLTGPVVTAEVPAPGSVAPSRGFNAVRELPRSYGSTFLFALPRDPHTIVTYWDIDWASIFGSDPRERAVYLRVLTIDDVEESRAAIEPMGENCYTNVLHADTSYRLELGYEAPDGDWHSLAMSASVSTPPDGIAEKSAIDVATVPFHLNFERLVQVFRGSKYDDRVLVNILAQLQNRAATKDALEPLTAEGAKLLRAIGWKVSERETNERSRMQSPPDERNAFLQGRVGQMLARASGGSSRSA